MENRHKGPELALHVWGREAKAFNQGKEAGLKEAVSLVAANTQLREDIAHLETLKKNYQAYGDTTGALPLAGVGYWLRKTWNAVLAAVREEVKDE